MLICGWCVLGRRGELWSVVPARTTSPDFGQFQEFIDYLFRGREEDFLPRLEVVMQAESYDLNPDLLEVVSLLPPGRYNRVKLCTQLNSSLSSHGWGYVYGTVQ